MCKLINGNFAAVVLLTALTFVKGHGGTNINGTIYYNISSLPRSCSEAMQILPAGTGVYTIFLPKSRLRPFQVFCLKDELGEAPWTVFQRRTSADVDFYRGWVEYKNGFGYLNEDFWLGLDKLSALTDDPQNPHELWVSVTMTDFADARYSHFVVGNEYELYELKKLGSYTGTAGDAFHYHEGMKFTTYDYDNDKRSSENCAKSRHGAWWYKSCYEANLNGKYGAQSEVGMVYGSVGGWKKSMTTSLMAIRPTKK